MWPLMFGGAALQYGSSLDQGTANRNSNSEYQNIQNNLNQNMVNNYGAAQGQLQGYSQDWKNNLMGWANAAPATSSLTTGEATQGANANAAVAQAQAATAGMGHDYNQGDTANSQVTQQAQNYYQPRLQDQIAQQQLGAGQQQMQYGQAQAGQQFANQEGAVGRGIQGTFMGLDQAGALNQNQQQQNWNLGQQNMRANAGIGRDANAIGSYMQLGGAALGYMNGLNKGNQGTDNGSFMTGGNYNMVPSGTQPAGGMGAGYYSNNTQETGPLLWNGARLQGPANT